MAKFAHLRQCRTWHRLAIFIVFSIVFLFAAQTGVFAGGRQDAALARADEHIKNKEHDEAILILSDFSRRNPQKFDLAQDRLRKIYKIREEFNRVADELVDTLTNEPENDEKILLLSTHLYTLEHENSPLLLNFVSRTREIAQFNVNRNRLRSIFERGRALLDRGETVAAINVYAEGMNFMRNEFFAAGYGEAIESEVRRETERVTTTIASFQQASAQLGTLSAEMTRAVNSADMARIAEVSGRLTPAMDRFIALKQGLYTTLTSFDRILGTLRIRDPEGADRSHIAFFVYGIRGRTGEEIQEGMLGAFDTHWRNSIGEVVNAIMQNVERENSSALSAFRAGNYQPVIAASGRTDSFFNLSPLYFNKHRELTAGSRPQSITLYGIVIQNTDIPQYMELRTLNESSNSLTQAANIATRQSIDRTSFASWQSGSMGATQALANEQQSRNNIIAAQRSLLDIITRANQVNTDTGRYHTSAHIPNAISAIEELRAVYVGQEQQAAQRYYTIAQRSLADNLPARRASLERGRNFLNGETRVVSEGVEVTFLYPAEALAELNALLTALTGDLQFGNSVLDVYRADPPPIAASTEISAVRESHQVTINDLNALRTQCLALADTARSRSTQAEAYRQEGVRLLGEAQAAFQRQNYDIARETIERAASRFSESLAIQESAAVRQMRDTQLLTLGRSIDTAANESIITEVRNLVNTARTAYFNGNFQIAEDNLVRARNRWRITNSEENEEVIYWLGIVRTAMAASSGRVIPPTAPLYPEMSQLLSQAQRNYEDGVRLINAGQRTQGTAKFEEARQITREIKLMFPVNQEAGILELRMEQFLNPAAFNASFEQRLRDAIAGTRRRSMESFADLQNLAEINPRYPNIRAIITQAEIDMGFRPPPPNPASVARSNELTASANRILTNNQTAQFEIALTQLNEAIILNPQNMDAPRIRDSLLRRMSVPGGIVLSSQDEADYQRALRELQAGNNLVAMALVERLMQNPNNRNITKLVELQNRIRSVL